MPMQTYDQATVDSTGAFLIGQLERFDNTIHEPLMSFRWGRDINVRQDATMGHDFTSFSISDFAAGGGVNPSGKSFIGKNSTTLPTVALDVGKVASPLYPWGMELGYSFFELQSAMQMGQPLDMQKANAIKKKQQQDIDYMVYVGDSDVGAYGLLNSPQPPTRLVSPSVGVAPTGGFTGTQAATNWLFKTADQILQDVNALLTAVWSATAFEHAPTKIGLAPGDITYLLTAKVSGAGDKSILTYIEENNISRRENGRPLEIVSMKLLTGTNNGNPNGPAATNRMIAYSQEYDLVRFPMVPMVALPMQQDSIYQKRAYCAKLGVVEFVYPETVGYMDGIG